MMFLRENIVSEVRYIPPLQKRSPFLQLHALILSASSGDVKMELVRGERLKKGEKQKWIKKWEQGQVAEWKSLD